MVFSVEITADGIFSSSKNITLDGVNYFKVLEQHMLNIWDILHDGAPARKSKRVKMLQEDREILIWEWPGNFPYLNLIENAWNFIKIMQKKSSQQALQTSMRCSLTYGSI